MPCLMYYVWVGLLLATAKIGLCRICHGTANRRSGSRSNDPKVYFKEYGNCTVINNNVEIVEFRGNFPDTTFLDSIEEVKGYIFIADSTFVNISMKSLRLVRGNDLYHGNSILIEQNDRLKRIIFPNLREIVRGNISITINRELCFAQTIDWDDIIYDKQNSKLIYTDNSAICEPCGEDCAINMCWSEEHCQKLNKVICKTKCSTGCLQENLFICCHDQCVAGCTHSPNDCMNCRKYNNSGECVDRCPRITEHDKGGAVDPRGRYHYENKCVKKCPNGTMVHDDSCVSICPENFVAVNNICKYCGFGSTCSKVCTVDDFLDEDNVEEIVNCSIIDGHFEILSSDLAPYFDQFSTITEITGFLVVQHLSEGIDDLSFLRNLKIIRGRRGKATSATNALNVVATKLKRLGLTSLERIEGDGIVIGLNHELEYLDLPSLKYVEGTVENVAKLQSNTKLCYVNNKTFEGLSQGPTTLIKVVGSRNETECEQEGKTCHEECVGGCWGPGNKQCRSCRKYELEGECLSSCDMHLNLYVDEGVCKRCHPQCVGGCYGEGALNCTSCRNAKDDSTCMEQCPELKYLDNKTRRCLKCDTLCKDGCTGPDRRLGKGGCSDCHILSLKTNECLAKEHICELGSFTDYKDTEVYDASGAKFERLMRTCNECNHMCINCSDKGTTFDVCHCRYVEYDGNCHKGCPSQQFNDSKKCKACDSECDECYGPGPDKCNICKNVRVYSHSIANSTLNESRYLDGLFANISNDSEHYSDVHGLPLEKSEYEPFTCLSECPIDKKFVEEQKSTRYDGAVVTQMICRPNYLRSMISSKTLIGVLVFGGICLFLIVAIVLGILRAQKAKAEENRAKLQAKIEGLNTEEILCPTNNKPDLSSLRLIKESELERGLEIGSGAFGTVYKGIWRPEGERVRVAVAIKVLIEGSTSAQHQELLEEARVMASVSNPCCIRILAVCLTRQMMLITPLVAHGCLLSYIRKNGQTLSGHILLKWAAQIAKGMGYLEQKGIVHRDLAARNILVQGLHQIKITDFGLAKLLKCDEEQYLAIGGKLPIKWLALESIEHRIFTHKSDVWSYGVTLWELFTYGQKPYESIDPMKLAGHLEMGERLPQPSICTIDVYMIMIKCWMIEADARPSFQDLEEIFTEMSRDPGRYLVVSENELMRMPSEMHKDNRSKVMKEMNLDDEEDLICGEDYLCPAILSPVMEEETSFANPEYMNNNTSDHGAQTQKLLNLESALQTKRARPSDHYMAEPGTVQLPRPPSLNEKEILSMEKAFYESNEKDDYMEPVVPADTRYLDMKSPGVAIETNSSNLFQRSKFGGKASDRDTGAIPISYSKRQD